MIRVLSKPKEAWSRMSTKLSQKLGCLEHGQNRENREMA